MMSNQAKRLSSQMQFCTEMMLHIARDLKVALEEGQYDYLDRVNLHTRYQDDIKRLRRELLSLSEMLEEKVK